MDPIQQIIAILGKYECGDIILPQAIEHIYEVCVEFGTEWMVKQYAEDFAEFVATGKFGLAEAMADSAMSQYGRGDDDE